MQDLYLFSLSSMDTFLLGGMGQDDGGSGSNFWPGDADTMGTNPGTYL